MAYETAGTQTIRNLNIRGRRVTLSPRARAIKGAKRHSYAVRLLRVVLPGATAGLLSLFLLSVLVSETTQIGPVTVDAIRIDEGALVMENPRMTGLDQNERAYALRADQASQRLDNSNQIDLEGIDATLAVDQIQDARIKAVGGLFDQEAEILNLFGGVNVVTTGGYVADIQTARVDLNAGAVTSQDPVKIDMLNGTLNAGGIEITDNGAVLKFSSPVRLVTRMQSETETSN
ncbi:MAG: LPS export ABC transporter periplasmic protein LptC [Pseudomonadota bacterium]